MKDSMSKKDPAFLFYSKDWIDGTAELFPEEKGVYIDLLAYQHQRGDLPNDTNRLARMVGLSVEQFEKIWSVISDKFETEGKRTLNRKLSEVMGERKDKGHTNKIIGVFGGLCKKSELTFEQLAPVRKEFKVADFKQYESEQVSERLTEWFNKRIALLEDVNEDVDIDTNNKGIPEFSEFYKYARTKKRVKKGELKLKYDSWVENGWRDGNDKNIKNWKSKLLNTLPFISEEPDIRIAL